MGVTAAATAATAAATARLSPCSMAAEQQQQAQWDAPLQQLLAHGVIDGYALISHPGLVLAACGELAGAAGEQPPPALRQLHALFHSPGE